MCVKIDEVVINKINKIEIIPTLNLVKTIYNKTINLLYSEKGNKEFYNFINPDFTRQRLDENNEIYVAKYNLKIIGMIEINKNKCRLSLLFVDLNYQNQGIGKKLLLYIKNRFKELSISKIYVHASPNSLEIYKKYGFKQLSNEIEEKGIKYYNMEMIL